FVKLKELARQNNNICPHFIDLNNTQNLSTFVTAILQNSTIDILIHNAAIQHACTLTHQDYGMQEIVQEVATNLVAPIELSRLLLPHLCSHQESKILLVSSGLALMPKKESAVYCATKAALHSFAQSLALQLNGSTVKVSEFILPLVDTPMTYGRGTGKLSTKQVANAIIESITKPHRSTIYVGKARFLPYLLRFAPWIARRIIQR
ncbi:MAG: SDR family NAD(P)-dependent oxidoreductase, partial [Gammaproteobacteria bacterium]|nr:SDR family NAD(P)-dependent oxidoreductase [Gammaproteobacteria bacterium]